MSKKTGSKNADGGGGGSKEPWNPFWNRDSAPIYHVPGTETPKTGVGNKETAGAKDATKTDKTAGEKKNGSSPSHPEETSKEHWHHQTKDRGSRIGRSPEKDDKLVKDGGTGTNQEKKKSIVPKAVGPATPRKSVDNKGETVRGRKPSGEKDKDGRKKSSVIQEDIYKAKSQPGRAGGPRSSQEKDKKSSVPKAAGPETPRTSLDNKKETGGTRKDSGKQDTKDGRKKSSVIQEDKSKGQSGRVGGSREIDDHDDEDRGPRTSQERHNKRSLVHQWIFSGGSPRNSGEKSKSVDSTTEPRGERTSDAKPLIDTTPQKPPPKKPLKSKPHHHILPELEEENKYIDKFFEHRNKPARVSIKEDKGHRLSTSSDFTFASKKLSNARPEEKEEEEEPQPPPNNDNVPAPIDSDISHDSYIETLNFSSDMSSSFGRPDMTWIKDDVDDDVPDDRSPDDGSSKKSSTGTSVPKPKPHHCHEPFPGIRHLLSFVAMMGCFPFTIYSTKAKKESGPITFCCMKKNLWGKLPFYFCTILLIGALGFCTVGVGGILATEVDNTRNVTNAEQYLNFEKLLLQKHWLTVSMFVMTLVVALVGNLTFIMAGDKIVKFVNAVGESFLVLDFNNVGRRWWLKFGLLHIYLTILDSVLLISLVATRAYGVREAMKFEAILYLRWFEHQAYLDVHVMNVGAWLVVFLEIYVYFVVRNHLVFILVLSRCITQSAQGWNARITYFLSTVAPNNLKKVVHLGTILSYEVLLKEHHAITNLVRGLSRTFPSILLVFFGTKLMSICVALFRAALTFLFDLKVKITDGEDSIRVGNGTVKYNPTKEESSFECAYYLTATILGLYVVIMGIAAVGDTVMDGFRPVRRFGLLLANSLKGRKFIMSLFMSFNAKKPHIVKPGWWFFVEKSLFMSILGMSLLLFSIMIQCRIINLVEVPIVLSCNDNECKLKDSIVPSQNGDNPKIIFEESNNKITYKVSPQELTEVVTQAIETTPIPPVTPPPTPPAPVKCSESSAKFPAYPEMEFDDKMNTCGLYCPYTRVYRMIPFDVAGQSLISTMQNGWNPHKMTEDCLSNPYKAFTQGIAYDCFGNCYDFLDDYNRFAFSLNPRKQNPIVPNSPFAYQSTKCFSDHLHKNKTYNPLEVCGIPYPYVENFYKSLHGQEVLKPLHLTETEIFSQKLHNNVRPKCSDPDPIPTANLKNIMTWGFYYKGEKIVRMMPYAYTYESVGAIIPMQSYGQVWNEKSKKFQIETNEQRELRLFAYPYAYIHPHYTTGSSRLKHSFGFHDCYGNELKDFDDCGGLGFYKVVEKSPGKFQLESPGYEMVTPSKHCFNDATSQTNSKCGVPTTLVDEVCKEWENYLNSFKPV